MFCCKCGAALINDALFCSTCGTKLRFEDNGALIDKTSAPDIEAERNTILVPILGKSIEFNKDIYIYIEIRRMFEELSQEVYDDFTGDFYSKYADMDRFIHSFEDNISEIFEEATSLISACLSEMNIFGVTDEEIFNYIDRYCSKTSQVVEKIIIKYNSIVANQEGMSQYRQQRKASRGRVVGGGFGISGAMKGMATAGALNMATGALHSIGNALGEMGTAIRVSAAKDKLFKESGMQYDFGIALKSDIADMHLALIDLINVHKRTKIRKYTTEDRAQANKIRSDLKNEVIAAHNVKAAALEMLHKDPFNAPSYEFIIYLFPDKVSEITEFATFFGFDINAYYVNFINFIDPAVDVLLEYSTYLNDLIADELDLGEDYIAPLTTDLQALLEYFEIIFNAANEKNFFFFPACSSMGATRLKGACSTYANYGKEAPLLLFDSTLGKSGKEGFLLTDGYVYLKNNKLRLDTVLNEIRQEKNPSNNCDYLYFCDHKVHLLGAGKIVEFELLGDFIEFIISAVLFLSAMKHSSASLWSAIEQYENLPRVSNLYAGGQKKIESKSAEVSIVYCFDCGSENDFDAKFCADCGSELM